MSFCRPPSRRAGLAARVAGLWLAAWIALPGLAQTESPDSAPTKHTSTLAHSQAAAAVPNADLDAPADHRAARHHHASWGVPLAIGGGAVAAWLLMRLGRPAGRSRSIKRKH